MEKKGEASKMDEREERTRNWKSGQAQSKMPGIGKAIVRIKRVGLPYWTFSYPDLIYSPKARSDRGA